MPAVIDAGVAAAVCLSSVGGGSASAGPAVSLREQQKQSGTQDSAQASPVSELVLETEATEPGIQRGSQAASRVTSPQAKAARSTATSRRLLRLKAIQ
jgi:hypothetical protein